MTAIPPVDIAFLLSTIRQVAESAPKGEWEEGVSKGSPYPVVTIDKQPMFSTGSAGKKRTQQECTLACLYVAALQPSTAILLCEVIEQLQAENEVLLTTIKQVSNKLDRMAQQSERFMSTVKNRGAA